MGMPITRVNFEKAAGQMNNLMQRGTVAMLLKGSSKSIYTFTSYEKAKETLKTDKVTISADGDKALELIFKGEVNKPQKVYVSFSEGTEAFLTDLQILEACQFDWFCAPEFEDKVEIMANWIIGLNTERGQETKAVFANHPADSEFICNFTTKDILLKGEGAKKSVAVSTSIFTARIASLLAGTPLTRAITNFPLDDVESVERLTNQEYDSKIDNGELLLFNDWDKVRIARGVTSLTTVGDKSEELKKILIVSKMQIWSKEVKHIINTQYKGNYANTYDNKVLLMTDLRQYNSELAKKGMLIEQADLNSIEIDLEEQEKFLKTELNVDTSIMTPDEILKADTKTKVFLIARVKFTEAMEDFEITVMS